MAQLLDTTALMGAKERGEREKAVRILAKTLYRELVANGYESRDLVALSSELVGLIATNIKPASK